MKSGSGCQKNKLAEYLEVSSLFFVLKSQLFFLNLQIGMTTGRGRDEFRYPIPIPVEKIHPHLHTQTQRILNFCTILQSCLF